MKLRLVGVLLAVSICGCVAIGQHAVEPFVLGSATPRDSWTGTVKSLDHEKSIITLEYEHKGKVESFTGTLKPPIQIVDKNGDPARPPIQIQMGDRLTVHYVKEGAKYSITAGGKPHDEVATTNLITKINFLKN